MKHEPATDRGSDHAHAAWATSQQVPVDAQANYSIPYHVGGYRLILVCRFDNASVARAVPGLRRSAGEMYSQQMQMNSRSRSSGRNSISTGPHQDRRRDLAHLHQHIQLFWPSCRNGKCHHIATRGGDVEVYYDTAGRSIRTRSSASKSGDENTLAELWASHPRSPGRYKVRLSLDSGR